MEYEKNFFHNLIKKTQVPEDCLIKENQSQKNEGQCVCDSFILLITHIITFSQCFQINKLLDNH